MYLPYQTCKRRWRTPNLRWSIGPHFVIRSNYFCLNLESTYVPSGFLCRYVLIDEPDTIVPSCKIQSNWSRRNHSKTISRQRNNTRRLKASKRPRGVAIFASASRSPVDLKLIRPGRWKPVFIPADSNQSTLVFLNASPASLTASTNRTLAPRPGLGSENESTKLRKLNGLKGLINTV